MIKLCSHKLCIYEFLGVVYFVLSQRPRCQPLLHTPDLLVQGSVQRRQHLSIPSVERIPGVLLLWAKPLSFYPAAIDGRCRRGCLSFVFLSEMQEEVGAPAGGERVQQEEEEDWQRERNTLFLLTQWLFLNTPLTACMVQPVLVWGPWHAWCGSLVTDEVMWRLTAQHRDDSEG